MDRKLNFQTGQKNGTLTLGKATAAINAGIAIYDAYKTFNNSNSSTEQKIGALINYNTP